MNILKAAVSYCLLVGLALLASRSEGFFLMSDDMATPASQEELATYNEIFRNWEACVASRLCRHRRNCLRECLLMASANLSEPRLFETKRSNVLLSLKDQKFNKAKWQCTLFGINCRTTKREYSSVDSVAKRLGLGAVDRRGRLSFLNSIHPKEKTSKVRQYKTAERWKRRAHSIAKAAAVPKRKSTGATGKKRGYNDMADLCMEYKCGGNAPGSIGYIKCVQKSKCA